MAADKPVHEVEGVDAALDALVSPTSSDVYSAVDGFSDQAVAAVAAKRALDAGVGSLPDPITDPVTIDTPDVLSSGGADSKFAVVDQQHEITIAWDYDGATNLTATIGGGYPGGWASLNATDDDSSVPQGYFDLSGDLVLAITNVGFESGGPAFSAHVHVAFGQLGDISTSQAFAVGTAASRTVSYRPGIIAVSNGVIVRGQILMYGSSDLYSPSIWIAAAEVAGLEAQAIFKLASADGVTARFVLNHSGGITINTADNSSPLILTNCPIVDPHIPGAVWNNGGVLTFSDGIAP